MGFAGSDQLNYSDPFGLCPEWVDGKPCDLKAAASFAAGFGDAVSFGATDWIRDKMGTNNVVDKDGAAYFGGQVTAVIATAAVGAAAEGAQEVSTTKTVTRAGSGADGATSRHLIETVKGETRSVTHQVERNGEIIHQHQTHIGKYGGRRQFPDKWVQYPEIKKT